jgi:hypothetical protein
MGRLSTFSQHQASVMMIMLIMSTVNNWLAILTFNPENVINSPRAHHAGVIERRVAHCEQQIPRIRRAAAGVATSRPRRCAMPTIRSTSIALFFASSPGAI